MLDIGPIEGEFDFGASFDVDAAAGGACLVEAVALDVDRFGGEGDFLK